MTRQAYKECYKCGKLVPKDSDHELYSPDGEDIYSCDEHQASYYVGGKQHAQETNTSMD